LIEPAYKNRQGIAATIDHGNERNIKVSKAMAAEDVNTRRPLSLTMRLTACSEMDRANYSTAILRRCGHLSFIQFGSGDGSKTTSLETLGNLNSELLNRSKHKRPRNTG
jgi:hypothetical protein